jgi:hypothetical protein
MHIFFVGGSTVIRHLPRFNPFTASYFALFSKKVTALYDLLTSFPFRRVVNINALFMISYYFPMSISYVLDAYIQKIK